MQNIRFFRCNICGNIVEMLHDGGGELVYCGKPMEELRENMTDGTSEKHVPVVEKNDKGFIVKVGSIPHPMEEKHFIQWIEVLFDDGKIGRKFLKPNDPPETQFFINKMPFKVYEYCNLHGLWVNKK